jgi:hypothetical protein
MEAKWNRQRVGRSVELGQYEGSEDRDPCELRALTSRELVLGRPFNASTVSSLQPNPPIKRSESPD